MAIRYLILIVYFYFIFLGKLTRLMYEKLTCLLHLDQYCPRVVII